MLALLMEKIMLYLAYPFVRYAIIVGVLIALSSSMFGVTLVLKRFSFIGDGLSHVAFGAISIATVLNLTNNMLFVLPVTVISAILLLTKSKNAKIKGDAAIAMISVGSLAIGYLLMNVFATSSNLSGDVCSTLFGSTSILTLSETEVTVSAVLSILVTVVFILFYNRLFAVTFDEDFSNATGIKAKQYNLLIAIIIAVIIVLAMNLVGSLLISALVIFPALSAMRVFNNFKAVTISACLSSVICSFSGIMISILAGTPVGATIVAINIVAFLLFSLVGVLKNGLGGIMKKLSLLVILAISLFVTGCEEAVANIEVTEPTSGITFERQAGNTVAATATETETTTTTTTTAASQTTVSQTVTETTAPVSTTESTTQLSSSITTTNTTVTTTTTAPSSTTEPITTTTMPSSTVETTTTAVAQPSNSIVDYDLTMLSQTMVYSALYDMLVNPAAYVDKTVRIRGTAFSDYDESSQQYYYFIIVTDEAACCQQGVEYRLAGENYPTDGETITVKGLFQQYQYEGDGMSYYRLNEAHIE